METNIYESLGINNPATSTYVETKTYYAENILTIIANIVLAVGVIGNPTVASAVTYKTAVNPMGIVLTIATLMSSVTLWALLRVICNISTSLKEINLKTK